MRHVITVIGSREQMAEAAPKIKPRQGEAQRETTWFACRDQEAPGTLLDDIGSVVLRFVQAPLLAYNLYQQVHSTKLWSGKRPLVLVRGRTLSSRVAAFAGRWGGGDVVMPAAPGTAPLGATRYLLLDDGSLELRDG